MERLVATYFAGFERKRSRSLLLMEIGCPISEGALEEPRADGQRSIVRQVCGKRGTLIVVVGGAAVTCE